MAKRPLRKTNTTVLIVVEGETEEAFAAHLKRLYYQRGMPLSVSIKNAHGYGPQGMIDKIKSVTQTADFDRRFAVLDTDIALLPAQEKWLRTQKIGLIFSSPAIEATLLAILGKQAPAVTGACKSELQKQAPGDPTDARYYEKYFSQATLETARLKNPTLEALIAALSKV
jgi:hypothetical protein